MPACQLIQIARHMLNWIVPLELKYKGKIFPAKANTSIVTFQACFKREDSTRMIETVLFDEVEVWQSGYVVYGNLKLLARLLVVDNIRHSCT